MRESVPLEIETQLDREYRSGKISIEEYADKKRIEITDRVRETLRPSSPVQKRAKHGK